jgi:predicted naringenin-chalcone synthase
VSLPILAIGTSVPEFNADQGEAAAIARQMVFGQVREDEWFDKLYELSMVARRGSVLLETPDEFGPNQSFYPPALAGDDRGPTTADRMQQYTKNAAPLACRAADLALHRTDVSPQEITHLITVTCTGFGSPGVDFALIEELGLSPDIRRIQIGFMGCHAAINALCVAQAIGESSPEARILLCSVELCSLHYSYGWDPSKMVANALFADGAAALVAGATDSSVADGHWQLRATGSHVMPNTADSMTWTIGDHGFEMTLSAAVPELIQQNLRPWVETWLARYGLTIEQVGSWAIHPGGPKIISSAGLALALKHGQTAASRHILATCGNMSSATILFVIDQLQKTGAPRPCVAMAFGPGLVIEAALFD